MEVSHSKITFIAPNSLYGDKEVTSYGSKGLVAHKYGKGWTISHAPSGALLRSSFIVTTKAEALARMDRLLALPIDWARGWDDMRDQFRAAGAEVRAIVG